LESRPRWRAWDSAGSCCATSVYFVCLVFTFFFFFLLWRLLGKSNSPGRTQQRYCLLFSGQEKF
jgi:hypothetical protein